MKDLYSPTFVAKEKQCAVKTVQRAISNDNLKAHRIIGPKGDVTGYGITKAAMDSWAPDPVRQAGQVKS